MREGVESDQSEKGEPERDTDRLSPSEIAELRRVKGEQDDRAREAFAPLRAELSASAEAEPSLASLRALVAKVVAGRRSPDNEFTDEEQAEMGRQGILYHPPPPYGHRDPG